MKLDPTAVVFAVGLLFVVTVAALLELGLIR